MLCVQVLRLYCSLHRIEKSKSFFAICTALLFNTNLSLFQCERLTTRGQRWTGDYSCYVSYSADPNKDNERKVLIHGTDIFGKRCIMFGLRSIGLERRTLLRFRVVFDRMT